MRMLRIAAALPLVLASSVAVMAQTVEPSGSGVAFDKLLEQVISGVGVLLVTLLTAFVGFAIAWLRAKTKLVDAQGVDANQQTFSEQLAHMMAFGETVAKDYIPHDGRIESNNQFLRAAYDYGHAMYPDTIGKLDFDAVAKAIVSRLSSGPMTAKAEAITVAKAGAVTAPVVVPAPPLPA